MDKCFELMMEVKISEELYVGWKKVIEVIKVFK